MPSNKTTNCEMGPDITEGRSPLATTFQNLTRKATGIRVGILQDWRQGSTSGKAPRRKANALRDGR